MEVVLTAMPPRSAHSRKTDALSILSAPAADAWIATTSAGAEPRAHLVPLSIAWIDETVVIAVDERSRTARNLETTGHARVGAGATRDVVMLDVTVRASYPQARASADLTGAYAAQADWDPSEPGGTNVYFVLVPDRIQAWREVNELADRSLMTGGHWRV
jgi:hypothetical protein